MVTPEIGRWAGSLRLGGFSFSFKGGENMIERQGEPIYIPTNDEVLAVGRWESFHMRTKSVFNGSLSDPKDNHTYVYNGGEGDFRFTAGWARATLGRAERALERSLTDSGINSTEWDKDWNNLLEGKLPQAPQIDTSEAVCRQGHVMENKTHYLKCGCCNQIDWKKPL
jgi:hypothetical protein